MGTSKYLRDEECLLSPYSSLYAKIFSPLECTNCAELRNSAHAWRGRLINGHENPSLYGAELPRGHEFQMTSDKGLQGFLLGLYLHPRAWHYQPCDLVNANHAPVLRSVKKRIPEFGGGEFCQVCGRWRKFKA